MSHIPTKLKLTQEAWEAYAQEQYKFYRKFMEPEDIEITPESEWVEIVETIPEMCDKFVCVHKYDGFKRERDTMPAQWELEYLEEIQGFQRDGDEWKQVAVFIDGEWTLL